MLWRNIFQWNKITSEELFVCLFMFVYFVCRFVFCVYLFVYVFGCFMGVCLCLCLFTFFLNFQLSEENEGLHETLKTSQENQKDLQTEVN